MVQRNSNQHSRAPTELALRHPPAIRHVSNNFQSPAQRLRRNIVEPRFGQPLLHQPVVQPVVFSYISASNALKPGLGQCASLTALPLSLEFFRLVFSADEHSFASRLICICDKDRYRADVFAATTPGTVVSAVCRLVLSLPVWVLSRHWAELPMQPGAPCCAASISPRTADWTPPSIHICLE